VSYILFLLILIAFCILMPRISFFKKSGIPQKWLIILFLARAFTGVFNCFLSYHFFISSDSLAFHNAALAENHWLKTYPFYFFREFFTNYGNNFSGILVTSGSFWNNLKSNVIIKTLAFLDFFTLRNFYINTLIFNISVFAGSIALFRVLNKRLPINKTALIIGVFLFPSGLFFTSAIHREGLAWMFLSFFIMMVDRLMSDGFSWKRMSFALFSLLILFSVRNYLTFVIIPALIAWWISYKKIKSPLLINVVIFLLSVVVLFNLKYLIPQADFPQFIANRLSDFDAISGKSRTYLPMSPLAPNFQAFITNFPIAFYHSFILPVWWDIRTYLELPFVVELLTVKILFIIWLFKKKSPPTPVALFILFISIASIIMIGYTVPNMGAIIRYRSIYLNLIFILLLSGIFKDPRAHYTYTHN